MYFVLVARNLPVEFSWWTVNPFWSSLFDYWHLCRSSPFNFMINMLLVHVYVWFWLGIFNLGLVWCMWISINDVNVNFLVYEVHNLLHTVIKCSRNSQEWLGFFFFFLILQYRLCTNGSRPFSAQFRWIFDTKSCFVHWTWRGDHEENSSVLVFLIKFRSSSRIKIWHLKACWNSALA